MRAALVLVAGWFALSACKTIPLNQDPTWPRAAARVSYPAIYEVAWKTPLVKLGLLEYLPSESAGPVVDPDTERVFVTTRDGFVRCLSPIDGSVEWKFQTHGRFVSAPTIHRGIVYVPGGDGTLYALRALTGELVWSFKAGEELASSPTVSDGRVFVASQSETLFAVALETGAWVWQYRRDPPQGFTVRGTARPVMGEGLLYMGFADGYLVALKPDTGVAIWEKRVTTTGGTQFLDVDTSPVVVGDQLIVASYKDGLASYDAQSGDLKWLTSHPGITALVARGQTVFATGDGALTAFELHQGRELWKVDVSDPTTRGPGINAGRALTLSRGYVVVPTATALAFVNPNTGALRTKWNPGRGVTATPAPFSSARYGNRLYVLTNLGTVIALDMVGAGG